MVRFPDDVTPDDDTRKCLKCREHKSLTAFAAGSSYCFECRRPNEESHLRAPRSHSPMPPAPCSIRDVTEANQIVAPLVYVFAQLKELGLGKDEEARGGY